MPKVPAAQPLERQRTARTIHLLRTQPVLIGANELVVRIGAICDEFECYGYRRVGAALRHQGIVTTKKLRRLMREHGLQPKRRRRWRIGSFRSSGRLSPASIRRLYQSAITQVRL